MKQLSIEEKAKRYDEAIEKAESLYKVSEPMSGCNVIIETIFPELKESENKGIGIKLIAFLKQCKAVYGDGFKQFGLDIEDAIAWIEKQGEHANFRNKIQIGDKVTRNEDGVLVNLSQLNRVASQGEQKLVPDWMPKFLDELRLKKNYFDWDEHKDIEGQILAIIKWMNPNYFKEKEGEQKPAEWSEEDEKMIENIIDTINIDISVCDVDDVGTKARFSLEKERDWLKNKLKSLRPQSQWKPSYEQMEALKDIFTRAGAFDDVLLSLINDLKKLREE